MTNVVNDSMFETAQDLRALVASAIPPPGAQLKDISTVEVLATTPSLVLAWQIYGEIDSESDLASRNNIANPWAVPGGTSLEVSVSLEPFRAAMTSSWRSITDGAVIYSPFDITR